ncbi:hypothetical protein GCM10010468_44730 [Actinocorallia longicatena]|uniref:Adenylate kinase family enzyme n=1 Tax=Actinocorallia longicatena TaxID=111803 RepID=A0ABP6QEF5_9ACTN
MVGVTGAGKSTLAAALGARLGLRYHEMDALYFTGPDWAVNATLVADVGRLTERPGWIIDSPGYPEVRDLLWERADTIVWLDYPRRVIMPRVLRRSLLRSARRERIFGGNRETWRSWLSHEHPVRWSWTQHGRRRAELALRVADPRFAHLDVHRFHDPAKADAWLRAQGRSVGGAA